MLRRLTPIALLSAPLALAACAGPRTNVMGAGPSAGCHAIAAQSVLGRRLDEQVTQEALRDSGALRMRVLPPGAVAATGNVDPMRLNVQLDAEGRIHRMQCG